MESDLAQIKYLLWAILGLQVFFIASNVVCNLYGCGRKAKPKYNDLLERGKLDEVLAQTKKRLETHPHDIDALYFRAKALMASGLPMSARPVIEQLIVAEPSLAKVAGKMLEAIDGRHSSDS